MQTDPWPNDEPPVHPADVPLAPLPEAWDAPVQVPPSSPYQDPSSNFATFSDPLFAPPPPATTPKRGNKRRIGAILLAALLLVFLTGFSTLFATGFLGQGKHTELIALGTKTPVGSATLNPTMTTLPVTQVPTRTTVPGVTHTPVAMTPTPLGTPPATATVAPSATATIAPTQTPGVTPTATPSPTITYFDDATVGTGVGQFQYVGTWGPTNDSRFYKGTDHVAHESGSSATIQFVGSRFQLVAQTTVGMGPIAISIDGGAPINVSEYSNQPIFQQVVFSSFVLADTTHTVSFAVVNSSLLINIDAIIVYS